MPSVTAGRRLMCLKCLMGKQRLLEKERKKPFLDGTDDAWGSSGPCKETTDSASGMHQCRCFPSSVSGGMLHPSAHHRAPSFSHYSLDGWVKLIQLTTPIGLQVADRQHQRGEMLNQS